MSRLSLCILILTVLLLAIPSTRYRESRPLMPDFLHFPEGEPRKTAFFDFLGPIIDAENALRLADRSRLAHLVHEPWQAGDREWLARLARQHGMEPPAEGASPGDDSTRELIDALLIHVDAVPRSLALAQAAKESAWGTSRFTLEGNNFFGQRCYDKGCGMVPAARAPGARFEVRRFDSPQASVASYLNNINGHLQYAGLRDYRARQRRLNQPVSGLLAAEQLTQYSERRQTYVDEVQSLIHFNKLEDPQ